MHRTTVDELDKSLAGGDLGDFIKLIWHNLEIDVLSVDHNDGKTALHLACGYGNLDIVKYTVKTRGADINVNDDYGRTALHYACATGKLDIIKYLVETRGANINVKDNDGNTALHYACHYGVLDVVKYLVETSGANINVNDNNGKTALHHACANGNLDIVKYLVESHNADINLRDKYNGTPLHDACENGHLRVVQYLVESSAANFSVRNVWNATALDVAKTNNHTNIIEFFANYSLHLYSHPQQQHKQSTISEAAEAHHQQKPGSITKLDADDSVRVDQDRLDSFRKEAMGDVSFLCGEGDEQQEIKANSGILLTTVPAIKQLISFAEQGRDQPRIETGSSPSSSPGITDNDSITIRLPTFHPKYVRFVLKCIYAGGVSFKDDDFGGGGTAGLEDLQQVILVADEFGFWRLKLVIEAELIRSHLTEETMVDMLLFADDRECVMLKDAAMKMAAENSSSLFTHPQFSKLVEKSMLLGEIYAQCSEGVSKTEVRNGSNDVPAKMTEMYEVSYGEKSMRMESHLDRALPPEPVRSDEHISELYSTLGGLFTVLCLIWFVLSGRRHARKV